MMKRILSYLAALAISVAPAFAQSITPQIGGGIGTGFDGGISSRSGAAPVLSCAQATTFLARANAVTTLDATHTNAYSNLICGGVLDGWWAKLDVFHVYATQSSGVALLNLPNTTYTATGVPTFTADRGFSNSTTDNNVVSTFNPSTATTPNYTQNSAHLSAWSLNVGTTPTQVVGIGTSGTNIFPEFTDGNLYLRVNDNPETSGFANTTTAGFFLGNRSAATVRQGYLNAVSVGTYGSSTSVAENAPLVSVGSSGGASNNSNKVAAISLGGSLTSTDVTNFYNRLRAYMTAVGVP